jgi:hypothetical protein
MNKSIVSLLIASALSLTGCATVYDSRSLNKVDSRALENIPFMQVTPPNNSPRQLNIDYKTAKDTVERYARVPSQRLTIYHTSSDPTESEELDTTGPFNNAVPIILGLENRLINSYNKATLLLGPADRGTQVSSLSGDKQISTESGLLGVVSYAVKPNFEVQVKEKTGLCHTRKETMYHFIIHFNQDDLKVRKCRRDLVRLGQYGLESTVGFAVAGVGGALGMASMNLIDGIYAYFEGIPAPKATLVSNGDSSISGNNLVCVLNQASRVGANSIITYTQNNQVVGLIYAQNPFNVISSEENTVEFDVSRKGANQLKLFLLNAAKVGVGFGIANSLSDNHIDNPCVNNGGSSNNSGGTVPVEFDGPSGK